MLMSTIFFVSFLSFCHAFSAHLTICIKITHIICITFWSLSSEELAWNGLPHSQSQRLHRHTDIQTHQIMLPDKGEILWSDNIALPCINEATHALTTLLLCWRRRRRRRRCVDWMESKSRFLRDEMRRNVFSVEYIYFPHKLRIDNITVYKHIQNCRPATWSSDTFRSLAEPVRTRRAVSQANRFVSVRHTFVNRWTVERCRSFARSSSHAESILRRCLLVSTYTSVGRTVTRHILSLVPTLKFI